MSWRLITKEADGREGVSSAIISRESALRWACDLIFRDKIIVTRLESTANETMSADDIRKWCEANIGRCSD